MKCEALQQQIYLYSELSDVEQAVVDRHVATCATCRNLLESMHQQQAMVREAAQHKPVLQDPHGLTDAVMASLGTQHFRAKVVLLDRAWLRYSAVAASLMLVVLFVLEQPWRQPQLPQQAAAVPLHQQEQMPVMDTRSLLEIQHQRRQAPQSTLFTTYADCIQHRDCDSELVRHYKNKMKL
jgi:hypothetical protein